MQTAPEPLNVISTQGSTLHLADGTQLIDGIASWWTACHGYQHPHILQAIQQQLSTLSHVMMGGLMHPQASRLAQRLIDLMPGSLNHVVYSESGSVAVEIALKIALQYWQLQGEPQRQHFISLKNAYHGDTLFTMSLCDPDTGMHRLLQPCLPQHYCIPMPETPEQLSALKVWLHQHAHTIAGIVIEPLVQGAAGMQMQSPEQLKALCTLCRQYNLLIIMDEIFTGFYRTGTLLACDQAAIIPDLLCLSKALTGGTLPLAVTIASTDLYQAFLSDDPHKALMHGTTFTGNALACAAANASLDLFERGIGTRSYSTQVQHIETHFLKTFMPLASLPNVKAVRIKGAIAAIELLSMRADELQALQQRCREDNIWIRPIGHVFYTTPALTIEDTLLDQITSTMIKHIIPYASKSNDLNHPISSHQRTRHQTLGVHP